MNSSPRGNHSPGKSHEDTQNTNNQQENDGNDGYYDEMPWREYPPMPFPYPPVWDQNPWMMWMYPPMWDMNPWMMWPMNYPLPYPPDDNVDYQPDGNIVDY